MILNSRVVNPTFDSGPTSIDLQIDYGHTDISRFTSNFVIVSGIVGELPVIVSGGSNAQVSVAGGAWTVSSTISNGQTLQVRTDAAVGLVCVAIGSIQFAFGVAAKYTASTTHVVESGVQKLIGHVWGGGAGGYLTDTCGGGGGGYARKKVDVTQGQSITVTVADSVAPATPGQSSSFGSFVSASGGLVGANGGSGDASAEAHYSGGASSGNAGAGGAGALGNGASVSSGDGGQGGAPFGGIGGKYGNPGQPPTTLWGGGGGAGISGPGAPGGGGGASNTASNRVGARGQVVVEYTGKLSA